MGSKTASFKVFLASSNSAISSKVTAGLFSTTSRSSILINSESGPPPPPYILSSKVFLYIYIYIYSTFWTPQ